MDIQEDTQKLKAIFGPLDYFENDDEDDNRGFRYAGFLCGTFEFTIRQSYDGRWQIYSDMHSKEIIEVCFSYVKLHYLLQALEAYFFDRVDTEISAV